jgi:hypothetical protein
LISILEQPKRLFGLALKRLKREFALSTRDSVEFWNVWQKEK